MVRFVVLSAQRSGSTLLCGCLNRVPCVRCMSECFWPGNLVDPTFDAFVSRVAPEGFANLSHDAQNYLLTRFLDAVCVDRPDLNGVGFKLLYYQFEQFPEILPWLQRRSVHVIHLFRKNTLKRLVSWIVKEKCGQSNSTRLLPQAQIRLDCENLTFLLEDMEAQNTAYKHAFSVQNSYLEVCYENFVACRSRETARIEAFLEMGSLGRLTSNTVKVNSDLVSDIVVNYNEVVSALKETRFAHFLDDAPTAQYR